MYGDIENVRSDVNTINDIIKRQGAKLVLDVIAEYIGLVALRFKLSSDDAIYARDSYLNDLKESINERI